jgi:hypothetical protein
MVKTTQWMDNQVAAGAFNGKILKCHASIQRVRANHPTIFGCFLRYQEQQYASLSAPLPVTFREHFEQGWKCVIVTESIVKALLLQVTPAGRPTGGFEKWLQIRIGQRFTRHQLWRPAPQNIQADLVGVWTGSD